MTEAEKNETFDENRKKILNEKYINKLENYSEKIQKSIDYSVERFDILIISLSTSGLIVSIGFVKDIFKDFESIDTQLLKASWLLFTLALIMNLISQITGYYAHKYDLDITNDIIRIKNGKKSKINKERSNCIMLVLNNSTQILNGLSLLSLISAIIILVIFISNNF